MKKEHRSDSLNPELRVAFLRRALPAFVAVGAGALVSVLVFVIYPPTRYGFAWWWIGAIWVAASAVAGPVWRNSSVIYGKASKLLQGPKVPMQVTFSSLASASPGDRCFMATVWEQDGFRAAFKGREQVMAIDSGTLPVLDESLLGTQELDAYCGFDPSDPIVVRTPRGLVILTVAADELKRNQATMAGERSNQLLQAKDYAGAAEAATRAIATDPTFWLSYALRGQAYINMERFEQALEDFDRAISLNQTDESLYLSRAFLLASMERDSEALSDLNQTLSIDPGHAYARMHKAGILMRKDRYHEAIDDLTMVIDNQPDNKEALLWRGFSFIHVRRYYNAIDDLSRVLELRPDAAEAYYYRAIAYEEAGEFARAEEDHRRAIELDPSYTREIGWG